jgi:hypothetical protein
MACAKILCRSLSLSVLRTDDENPRSRMPEKSGISKLSVVDDNSVSLVLGNRGNSSRTTLRDSRPNGKPILTKEQARVIFGFKHEQMSEQRKRARELGLIYGVNSKTIRDIWLGRTWYRETYHLDQDHPPMMSRLLRKAGRPKGVKDSKPRVKKIRSPNSEPVLIEEARCGQTVPCMMIRPLHDLSLSDDFEQLELEIFNASARSKEPFEDPFHDDWAYWTTSNLLTTADE